MQKSYPRVSIIVISYNEVHAIGNCINKILSQTYADFEIIVYDNASSDGTPEYIEQTFPQVKLIKGSENLGFGGANNLATQMATGKYVAFVNDDAYVTPDWLQPLVTLLESDSSVGCAGAELACSEKPNTVLCHGNGIHLSGVTYLRDRGQPIQPSDCIEVGGISGAAFVISRELFLGIGGFESNFFLYYEDTDLSLRLHLLGKRCVVIPGAIVYHNSQSRFGVNKIFFLERNRYLSLFTLMNAPMLVLMAPSMLVFEAISWGYCLLKGKEALLSKVKAWQAIYELRHWIMERRHKYMQQSVSVKNHLKVFTPFIHIEYVDSNKVLGIVASIIGWLIAAPIFALFHPFSHHKTSRFSILSQD